MIDVISDMLDLAERAVKGKAYRSWPAVQNLTDPYAVVTPSGRTVLQSDDRGGELVVQLSYNVDIFANSQEAVNEAVELLTNLYNSKSIQCTGYSPSYATDNEMYTATASYYVVVDVRGMTYNGA